ncbi:hypothetical protein NPX13_g3698 [Xylaria arbuscula]|uniref:Ricin B lectin domain-containing protein n=1 Tax=Xylaria arbuscula TaxID=114810 RepID=A0A9W8NI88_9PEZI|nr:hypothetical protein NPX13_g3698 [Xylaria arbuscula]
MNFLWFASFIHLATQSPVLFRRVVTQLDQTAFEEAQQPDATATKAFASTLIKTADDRCLFVDKFSGDFRANLTPVQIADCGSTDGQEWDIITNGKHNNVADSMLVVSTLTNACLNFDPRRPAGNQVILFSCGGRADGGGEVTDSQLFPFNGGAAHRKHPTPTTASFSPTSTSLDQGTTIITTTTGDATTTTAATSSASVVGIANPTETVPVSRAGLVLQPSAVAEAHQRDDTATRAFESISIQASDGRLSLKTCEDTPNEKFDIITAGKHNDENNSALVVSSLMNGCISFDGRRQVGDTVTIFSCGGRADGGGDTNSGQLIPYTGGTQLVLAPVSERNVTCIVPASDRLDSAPCIDDNSQLFKILS